VDIFRESATNLTIITEQGRSTIRVDLESDSLVGFLKIQVYPDVRVHSRGGLTCGVAA
jgi:hypothetical protein